MEKNSIVRSKCIIMGESTAGKTSLIQTLIDPSLFPKNYKMTLGVEIHTKRIKVPDTTTTVELFLYDCSGKTYFRDLVKRMSNQTSLVIMVYDVTNEASFTAVAPLLEDLKSASGVSGLKGVLYGSKTDLVNRRVVSPKAGHDLAQKLGLAYFEGSAKDNKDVEDPFYYMVNEWFKQYTDKSQGIRIAT